MPWTCFSYPAGVPGTGTRGAAQPAPPGLRRMPQSCFSYPADVPRSMPLPCFSYPADVPPGIRNGNAALRDPCRMPYSCFSYPVSCFSDPADVPRGMPVAPCFSYPDDVQASVRTRSAARPAPPGLRQMPVMCFNY